MIFGNGRICPLRWMDCAVFLNQTLLFSGRAEKEESQSPQKTRDHLTRYEEVAGEKDE